MNPFFVNNGLVAARCPEWLRSSFTILINLFEWIHLRANAEKMKVIMCLLGKIWVAQMENKYTNQMPAFGTSMTKPWRINCEVCGTSLAAESLWSHLETQHNIFQLFALNRDIVFACAPEVYSATKTSNTDMHFCPVPWCGGPLGNKSHLCYHFLMQNPQDLVCIPIKLLQCKGCGMQMLVKDLKGGHDCTELCQHEWERKW